MTLPEPIEIQPGGDHCDRPNLTERRVLKWANAFFKRTGAWPDWHSGPIPGASGETWFMVAGALALGQRGLPRGGSLNQLLLDHRRHVDLVSPSFSAERILAWADAWIVATGDRPRRSSGQIPGSGGVDWQTVDRALRIGRSDLGGKSSLAGFLGIHRPPHSRQPVTENQILFWVDAFRARTGHWPTAASGPIPEAPGENWQAMNRALKLGLRSLPGGWTLAQLLDIHREKRKRGRPSSLRAITTN